MCCGRTWFLSLVLLFIPAQAFSETLTIYTENFPPYNHAVNGELTGICTKIVKAVMEETGYSYQFKISPWARTMALAKQDTHGLIFSISRTKERESHYRWIGELVPTKQSVFAAKERTDIHIKQLDDLKAYRIGTTIGDARESYLVSKGFSLKDFDRISGDKSYSRNYEKLLVGRIDVIPMPDIVMRYVVNQHGEAIDDTLRKVYELSDISKTGYYLAANIDLPNPIFETIQSTLEAFKQTPYYNEIVEQ